MKHTKKILSVGIALLLLFSTANIVFAADPPPAPTMSLEVDTGLAGDNITGNGTMNVGNLQSGATWEYSINSGVNWIAGSGTSFVLPDGTYNASTILVRQSVDGVYSNNQSNASTIVVAQNQIYNGDFQLGDTGFTTDYINYAYCPDFDLAEGYYDVVSDGHDVHRGFVSAYDHTYGNSSGLYFVANGSFDTTDVVWQSTSAISVEANQDYRFEAYLATLSGWNSAYTDGGYPKLKFQIGDGTNWVDLGNSNVDWGSSPLGTWFAIYADGTFSSAGTYYIRLINQQPYNYNDFAVDDIYFGLRGAAPSASNPTTNPTSTPSTFDTSSLLSLELASDTGYSNTDKITSNGVVNVFGLQAPYYWQYSIDGGAWVTAESETTSFTVTGNGTHSVVVHQMDYSEMWSEPSAPLIFTLDATAPTVTISSTETSPTNADPIPVILTFSEDVYGLSLDDITVTNGTKSNLLGSGSSYTLDVAPDAEGTVTVTIGSGTFQDIAGNNNQSSAAFSITYDITPPSDGSVSINSGATYTNNTSVTLTLASSEDATQVMMSENSDFSGASFQAFDGNPKNFALSATNGTKTVYVKYADAAGNETTRVSDSIILDTTQPTVTITTTESDPTNALVIPITITFSEDVTGFSESSLTTFMATVENFSGSGSVYTCDLIPVPVNSQLVVSIDVGSAFDAAGNYSLASNFFTIESDTIPPTGSIVLNDGDEYTMDNRVGIRISAEGATGYMYSEDPTFAGESYTAYSTAVTTTYNFSSSDGVKTLYVKLKDAAGNETTTTISDSIILDTTAPTEPSVSISGGMFTNSTTLNLSLSAIDADYMIISESASFTGASYEDYNTSKTFTVSGGDGMKYVYVRYKDKAGNVSDLKYDYVILDTTPPTNGSILINNGATVTNQQTVELTLSASGAEFMMVSESSTFEGASYESYDTTKNFTLSSGDGTKTVYVKYKDIVGNETTETISDSIVYDTTPPVNEYAYVAGGAVYTNNRTITLVIGATGAHEVILSEDIDFTGASYQIYTPYQASFQLSEGDGLKCIYVKYRDEAGNESDVRTVYIRLDTAAPTASITSTESSPTNATAIPISVQFNETVFVFSASDITVTNGTVSNFRNDIVINKYAFDIIPTADGEITVDIDAGVVIDLADNNNVAATQFSIVSDQTPPSDGAISINDGDTETSDKNVTLRFYVVGATQMMISENADFSGASYESFAPLISKSYTLSDGDGTKTVYVKYCDEAGNESEVASATIVLDTTAPTNASILINNGDAFTADGTVELKLSADAAVEMIISEKSDFSDATYETYAASKSITLSSGDGTKIVYVKYKDALGNETDALSDRIVLDTTAPTNASISINKGDSVAGSRNVTISLFANDASEMIISENANFKGASYEAYATSKSFTLSSGDGTKIVYVKYKDAIGNETDAISDQIVLDTYVAPSEPLYGTVSGYVTDENGNPIPNVLVELHSDVRQTRTDTDGYFEFTDVPVGEHMLYILDDRFEAATDLTVAISSTVNGICTEDECSGDELDNGLQVEVGESQELQINFVAQADMTANDDDSTDDTDDTDVDVPTASDDAKGFPTWALWLIGVGVLGAIFFIILGKRRKDDEDEEEE